MQRKFYKTCTNDTIIEENNDRTLLKLLDEVTGGWPVVKGGNWNGGEFNWTSIMIKARKLGFFYQFYFSVGVYTGNSTKMLWVSMRICALSLRSPFELFPSLFIYCST